MRSHRLPCSAMVALLLALLVSSVTAQGISPTLGDGLSRTFPAQPFAPRSANGPSTPIVGTGTLSIAAAHVPTTVLTWQGAIEGRSGYQGGLFGGPDVNSAIGPTEFIEASQDTLDVYDRSGHLRSSGANFGGQAQVVWNPQRNRFLVTGTTFSQGLIFGYSKGPSPSADLSDWCTYSSDFGGLFSNDSYTYLVPQDPKIGMVDDLLIIGVNRFNYTVELGNEWYQDSEILWVNLPVGATASGCPAINPQRIGAVSNLLNPDGSSAASPAVANAVDPGHVGYTIAAGSGTALSLFTVRKDPRTGGAVVSTAWTVSVPAFTAPPSIPQPGTTFTLTVDQRLGNAVLAFDPEFGIEALWTQHTVAASPGGLGSEVRWYEINPATRAVLQRGSVRDPQLYAFSGAIASNRNGPTQRFGGSMVLAFNTSSSTSLIAAHMVSKKGTNPQSRVVQIAQSAAPYTDTSCHIIDPIPAPCPWSPSSGASPDPASTTGNVWLSAVLIPSAGSPNYTIENWEAAP